MTPQREEVAVTPSTDDDSPAPAPRADVPRTALRYEILGEHGRGGIGRVSRAFDRDLGRTSPSRS
jgi:hypothetical protein